MEIESGAGTVPEQRLIIGLDYGTTYTGRVLVTALQVSSIKIAGLGVAYATPLGDTSNLNDIDAVTDWGKRMDNHDKVPSVKSYSNRTEAGQAQWGSDLSPGAVAMVHTKLELDIGQVSEELDLILQSLKGMRNLNFQHIQTSTGLRGLPEYPYKSPEEITTEYLTNVFQYLERVVTSFSEVLRRTISTDIVVTVPTVCTVAISEIYSSN